MKKVLLITVCFTMILVGWFANDVFQNKEATADKILEYKVIPPDKFIDISSPEERAKSLEQILNAQAGQGWKLHSFAGPLIFER